jgi:MFS family permease
LASLAPLVLVALRFLQGFSLGGESAAGPLLAMESAPGNTRGYFAALVSSGAAAGTVLGRCAVFAVGALPREQLLSWGWRLPFLLSAPIFAISFYVRMKVEESPIFQRAVQRSAPGARAAARRARALQDRDAAGTALRDGGVVDVLLHVGVRPVLRHSNAQAQ